MRQVWNQFGFLRVGLNSVVEIFFLIFLAIGPFGHRDSYHLPPLQKNSSSNKKKPSPSLGFVLESEKIITFFLSPPRIRKNHYLISVTSSNQKKSSPSLGFVLESEKIITFFPSPPRIRKNHHLLSVTSFWNVLIKSACFTHKNIKRKIVGIGSKWSVLNP